MLATLIKHYWYMTRKLTLLETQLKWTYEHFNFNVDTQKVVTMLVPV